MKFTIKPKSGIDLMHFGMDRDHVRRAFGGEFESFLRTEDSEIPCDYFPHSGVFAYYKFPDVLEALEFAKPAEVYFEHANLVGAHVLNVKKLMDNFDQCLEMDSSGIISHELGIAIFAPGWDEDGLQVVESVFVFEDGYYS